MFSRLISRTATSARTSRNAALPASVMQKRHVAVNKVTPTKEVVYLRDTLSTEKLSEEIETVVKQMPEGELDFEYTSKYPDITFEQYDKEYEEEMKRPFFISEELFEFGEDMLGFSRKEMEIGATREPLKFLKDDGSLDVTAFANTFSGITKDTDDLVNALIKRITEGSNISRLMKNPPKPKVDRDKYVSKETAAELDALYKVAQSAVPVIDVDAVTAKLQAKFDSVMEQYKDALIDNFEAVKEHNKELEFLSLFLDTGEDGLPKVDMDSFEFLETYFPEEVEAVIEEIELGEWDAEYINEDPKVTRAGPEQLFLNNKNWAAKEYAKVDEQLKNELAISASVSEEEKNFQILYQEVMGIARYNKELETEIGQIKFLLGGEAEESSDKKKEEVEEDPVDEAVFGKIMEEIMADRKPSSIGDAEHMENEAAKAKAARQIKNLMAGYDADYEGEVRSIRR